MDKMQNTIEVEYIGHISKNKFIELKERLEKEGSLKSTKNRLTLMYFRDKIPKDIKDIEDEKVDLRLRITNYQSELILKYGLFTGAHARDEISFKFEENEFEKYIKLLKYLDWNLVVIYATKTYVYNYKDVEFSLVEIYDFGYNFEIEILTSQSNEENARKKISDICDEFKIKHFDNEELRKQCNLINNTKELQYDLRSINFNDIKKRFRSFFREGD